MSGGHSNYSIVEIGQNTEKSPVNLRRLSSGKPSANAEEENSQMCKIIISGFCLKKRKKLNQFFSFALGRWCIRKNILALKNQLTKYIKVGVMVKVLDCIIVECEFELQSRYDVNYRTNTLGKGLNSLILPPMG